MVGCEEYSKEDAIAILMAKSKGDKAYTMFHAVLAAKLNVELGINLGEYADCLEAADAWMCDNVDPKMPEHTKIKGNSEAWTDGDPLYECLDAFNNNVPYEDD